MTEKRLRVFGFGGQGVITMAHLLGEAAVLDRKEVIMTEEYSPYITGGWSRADLIVSGEKIDYPLVSEIDYLITLSQEGLDTNVSRLSDASKVFVEKTLVKPSGIERERVMEINAKEIAKSIGSARAINIVMLGFFNCISGLVSKESLNSAVNKRFPKFQRMNSEALDAGYREGLSHV